MDILSLIQTYLDLFQNNFLVWSLFIPLIFIGLDLITGILAAIKQGIFNWKKFLDFLDTGIFPFLVIIATVFLAFILSSGNQLAATSFIVLGMGGHLIKTLGSIVENLKELGVPPAIVQEVEQVGQQVLNDIPQWAQPIDKQATMVVPAVVRDNTPPPTPTPVPTPIPTPVPMQPLPVVTPIPLAPPTPVAPPEPLVTLPVGL